MSESFWVVLDLTRSRVIVSKTTSANEITPNGTLTDTLQVFTFNMSQQEMHSIVNKNVRIQIFLVYHLFLLLTVYTAYEKSCLV